MNGKDEWYIPDNIGAFYGMMGKDIQGIPIRNVLEAAVLAIAAFELVNLIPFVSMIHYCVNILTLVIVFFVGCMGFKGEPVSLFVLGFFKFQMNKQKYRLYPPNKGTTTQGVNADEEREEVEETE